MSRPFLSAALVVLGLAVQGMPAQAEKLVVALASERIGITSNFSGASVVAIAVVERDGQSISRSGDYDAVVVVRGPARTQVIRNKVRWAGLWLNGPSRTYMGAPTYFATLGNRAFADMAEGKLRGDYGIGVDFLKLSGRGRLPEGAEDKLFRDAFVASKRAEGLYVENEKAITFINDTVMRARFPLPPNTPVGVYSLEFLLLSQGALVARGEASFELVKDGFEASVFRISREQPLAYGIASVLLALAMGWTAGIVFRRN